MSFVHATVSIDVPTPDVGDSRDWLLAIKDELEEQAAHHRGNASGYDEQLLDSATCYKFVADELERLRRSSANAGRTRGEVFGQLKPIREDARCLAESTDNLVKSIDLVLQGAAP